jgi:hypothetical protein
MKKTILITLFILIAILAAACGQATPSPEIEPSGQTPQATNSGSGDPYPAQVQQQGSTYVSPYPPPAGFEDARYMTYWDLETLIKDGGVASILLTANKEAFVTMSDGSKIWANGVEADLLTNVIAQCGAPCAEIKVTNQ